MLFRVIETVDDITVDIDLPEDLIVTSDEDKQFRFRFDATGEIVTVGVYVRNVQILSLGNCASADSFSDGN
ncbi:MAG: hypothetical protein V3T56_00570, partial [Gemmatimonadales bacterium]